MKLQKYSDAIINGCSVPLKKQPIVGNILSNNASCYYMKNTDGSYI